MLKRIIPTLFFWLVYGASLYGQGPVQLQPGAGIQDVGSEAWVLVDPAGQWGVADVLQPGHAAKFAQSKLQVPNFNSTQAAAWLRLRLQVPPGQRYLLEIGYPLLNELEFYMVKDGQVVGQAQGGTSKPFGERSFAHPNFYFELSPECDTYYIRATSYEILQFPLRVGTVEDLMGQALKVALINGIYFGFVGLIVLYNLFLYLRTRERVYRSYVLYVLAVGLVTANLLGYNFQFLYPQAPWLSFYTPILYPLNFFVLIFSLDFLNIRERAPRYHRWFWALVWVCWAEIGLNLAGFPHLMFQISQGVGLLIVGLILFVAGKLYRQGYRPAMFFLLAFMAFLLGIVTTILLSSGAIPYSTLAYHSIQLGSALEIVLLSFAVADKINIYKKETEVAQLAALHQAEENRQILSLQNEELEVKVRARTEELEQQKLEVLAQNEQMLQVQGELLAKRQELEQQNGKLVEYYDQLNAISLDLQVANSNLEAQVQERTRSLTQANATLQKQNQQLEEYAFVTSHHLRAPVARLLGLAMLLEHDPDRQAANAPLIGKLVDETKDLDTVIRDLNLMLAAQKQQDLPREAVDLAAQANLALQKLAAELASAGAEVTLDLSAVPRLWTVGQYLQNTLLRLLDNALRFRDPARPLRVVVRSAGEAGGEACISVQDNGLGIDLRYAQNKLFGLYQRFHPMIEGKGMGLFLVKTEVEHLGGRVEVSSEVNVGTTFSVYLPEAVLNGQSAAALSEKTG
jgi:two-component system, sensor histidine kinase LadS